MRHALDRLAAVWALLGGMILLTIVAVTVTNAGAFGLDKLARMGGATVAGLPGYEDFVTLAIGAASPMFLPYAQARRGHLAVDLFTSKASPSVQRGLERIGQLLTAALALFLAYWMVYGMLQTMDDNALSRVLGWPVWPFYGPGIVSLLLWAAVAAVQVFETDAPGEAAHG
ncbi:MAG: TRAP transporter small permease [Rhodobacteraceae bacterium]|nr:TRAP transporter small permease [Paracoccaceae bacterium]